MTAISSLTSGDAHPPGVDITLCPGFLGLYPRAEGSPPDQVRRQLSLAISNTYSLTNPSLAWIA